MKILVTGGTGVIGRRVVPQLLAAGHSVTATGRSPGKRLQLERRGARVIALDLFDPEAVQGAVAGHEVVVNLATHIPSSSMRMMMRSAWRENDRVRSEGSNNLVDAALATGVARFVQESFAPIYPDQGDRWIDESVPVKPAAYNRSTVDAEHATARFAARGGSGVVLRFGGLYGSDALTSELLRIVRMGWAALPGKPEAFFSSITQDDAAGAVVAALELPSGIYNATDDEPLTRRDLFGAIATTLRINPPKFPPAWTAVLMGSVGECMSRSQRITNRKLRQATGWAPAFPSAREGWPVVIDELQRNGLEQGAERATA